MGFNDEAISCNLSVEFRYPLWTHLRNLVSVTVSIYALERIIAACVEGWMNKYGGSQVAAQINVLQGDVTTSNSHINEQVRIRHINIWAYCKQQIKKH